MANESELEWCKEKLDSLDMDSLDKSFAMWDSELPELVCARIISKLDADALKSLRLVSFHWNRSVEATGALRYVMEEMQPDSLKFLQRIAPQSLYVRVALVKAWTDFIYNAIGLCLKELKVQSGIDDGFADYLQLLPNLTSLTLDGDSLYTNELEDPISEEFAGWKLDFLKTLRLRAVEPDDRLNIKALHKVFGRTLQLNINFIFKHLKARQLAFLEISDYVTTESRTTRGDDDPELIWEDEALIPFISSHSNTLRTLRLACAGPHDHTKDKDEKHRVPNLLTEVSLRFRENEGCFMNSSFNYDAPNTAYWIRLLLAQSNLKKLDLCSFASFSKPVFRSIVQMNQSSLTEINCCGLSLVDTTAVEFLKTPDTSIERCQRLTVLKLGLGCLYTSFDTLLTRIPQSIEVLDIMCTRIPMQELQNIIVLRNLKSLFLVGVAFNNSGFDGDFVQLGEALNEKTIRFEGLKKIMRMRSLNVLNVSGFHDFPSSFNTDKFEEFCVRLQPFSKIGEEFDFEELDKILSIKVRIKALVRIMQAQEIGQFRQQEFISNQISEIVIGKFEGNGSI